MFKEKLFTRTIEVTEAVIKCVDLETEQFKEVNISIPYRLSGDDILTYVTEKMNIVGIKVVQAEYKVVKASVGLSVFYNLAYTAGKIEPAVESEQEESEQEDKSKTKK